MKFDTGNHTHKASSFFPLASSVNVPQITLMFLKIELILIRISNPIRSSIRQGKKFEVYSRIIKTKMEVGLAGKSTSSFATRLPRGNQMSTTLPLTS